MIHSEELTTKFQLTPQSRFDSDVLAAAEGWAVTFCRWDLKVNGLMSETSNNERVPINFLAQITG